MKLRAGNYQNQTLAHRRVCPPWLLDSGNPCRNDGVFSPTKLVYNDVSRSLGTSVKSLFFVPLRTLRETSFSSNDGITRIPRNISTRTDLCITARAPAWPLFGKLELQKPHSQAEASILLTQPSYRQGLPVSRTQGGESGLPSMATGCIRDFHVPNPSGGEAVQIGYPADLSGNPCRNDEQKPVSTVLSGRLGNEQQSKSLAIFLACS